MADPHFDTKTHAPKGLAGLAPGVLGAFKDPAVVSILTLTGTLVAVATLFYRWAEGWSLLDALYFSVITISTVGYGDFSPQTDLGKMFTIGYIIIGVGLFVAAATALADAILTRREALRQAASSAAATTKPSE